MKPRFSNGAVSVCFSVLLPFSSVGANAQSKISAAEAHAIGVDAYLYPLVAMDTTRKQATNIEPGKEFGKGPINMFVNVPEYPPATLRGVVRPNWRPLMMPRREQTTGATQKG